jgi:hypothetical protein
MCVLRFRRFAEIPLALGLVSAVRAVTIFVLEKNNALWFMDVVL